MESCRLRTRVPKGTKPGRPWIFLIMTNNLGANNINICKYATAAELAQLDKRRSAEREAAGSSPGRTNTHGL